MSSKDFILSPSLLSADFGNLRQELQALEQAGLQWVHWDVMDGAFVPNITLGPQIISACRKNSRLFFDVHLMIQNPENYLQDFAAAGADLLCVHAEVCPHLESVISRIQELGCRAAVALNPHTPLCHLDYILPSLDMVLLMSVNPGFGGQRFIPFCLDKIRDLQAKVQAQNPQTLIQVDGGIDLNNIADVLQHGANVLVSGSAFFRIKPYTQAIQDFTQACACLEKN
ncbi:MAG: ribulose-phosphate 3-epimerase [Thermodesulfobacteriota bacterium]